MMALWLTLFTGSWMSVSILVAVGIWRETGWMIRICHWLEKRQRQKDWPRAKIVK